MSRIKGFKLTEEHKKRISEAHSKLSLLGLKKYKHRPEVLAKRVELRKYPELYNKNWMEQKYSKEKLLLREIADLIGCPLPLVSKALKVMGIKTRGHVKGSTHWQWKGGISNQRVAKCTTIPYKIWRKAVFERDDYICQACGQRGWKLEAHHVLPYRDFPHLIHALQNGMTLCKKCHSKTIKKEYLFIHTYAKRGELLGSLKVLLPMIISSQVPEEILEKVQRLIAESDKDSNANTSALPVREDIVCAVGKLTEITDK